MTKKPTPLLGLVLIGGEGAAQLSRERKLKDFPVAEATTHCIHRIQGIYLDLMQKPPPWWLTGFHNKSLLLDDWFSQPKELYKLTREESTLQLLDMRFMNHSNDHHGRISLKVQLWHLYIRDNKSLFNWTSGSLNRREFMLNNLNLDNYTWLVRSWTLKENLLLPFLWTSIISNFILSLCLQISVSPFIN